MKRGGLVVLLAACNQVYGLDPTVLVDAVPPDAAPSCDRELAFGPQLHQAVYQRCNSYTIAVDTQRALAVCTSDLRRYPAEGPRDAPLEEVVVEGFDPTVLLTPQLFPEGDRAVFTRPLANLLPEFVVYKRRNGAWQIAYTLLAADYDDSIGTPSRRPNAHIMHSRPNTGAVDEYVEAAPDVWTLVRSYTPAELGTISLYTPFNLTPDGLHVVFLAYLPGGEIVVLHAQRDSVDTPFGPGVPVMGIPRSAGTPFMTHDCGRVYLSGLSSIFYAQQR